MSFEIALILVLILANGFFAMSEIAIVSARKAKLQQMENEGDARAGRALALANRPDDFLSTTQIGITLVSTLAGAFGGATIAETLEVRLAAIPRLAPYAGPAAMAIVVIAISYLSLIAGELVPKRVALGRPERIASSVAGFMALLSRIASPAVRFLAFSSNLVIRLLPLKHAGDDAVTPEEIKVLIEQGTQAGTFLESEQEMLEGVLRLGGRRIVELMTPRFRIVWLDLEAPLPENLNKISATPHSRFPAGHGSLDQPAGILHAKDLLKFGPNPSRDQIESVLKKPLLAPETTRALQLLDQFRDSGKQVALVVDEHGSVEGLVTLADIMGTVVGDREEAKEEDEETGVRSLDGMMPISDFKEMMGMRQLLPGEGEGAFHTLGGFVMMHLARIPRPGEKFLLNGLEFEVSGMAGRRVDKVTIRKLPEAPGE